MRASFPASRRSDGTPARSRACARAVALCVAAVLFGAVVPFRAAVAAAAPAATDYSQPAAWVCRPGADDICTTGLDATVLNADGTRTSDAFKAAVDPPIDCFYVYPTVSPERQPYADLTLSPEIARVTKQQAGRLSSRCRVFVPVYRQVTLYHIAHQAGSEPMMWTRPAEDVAAALRYYFEHDNRGRGVVLIGHSQGSILLQGIIAGGIDGRPAQSLLVAAFLAGDPSFGVPHGRAVGGSLKHIPVCADAAQTGCVYVWGSYASDDFSGVQAFGGPRADALESACVNPAAPSGGSGDLKFVYPRSRELAPGDAPFAEVDGALSGSCRSLPAGNGFRVVVKPGAESSALKRLFARETAADGWGLHVLDVALVQGNILDAIDAETATWLASHAAAHSTAEPPR